MITSTASGQKAKCWQQDNGQQIPKPKTKNPKKSKKPNKKESWMNFLFCQFIGNEWNFGCSQHCIRSINKLKILQRVELMEEGNGKEYKNFEICMIECTTNFK